VARAAPGCQTVAPGLRFHLARFPPSGLQVSGIVETLTEELMVNQILPNNCLKHRPILRSQRSWYTLLTKHQFDCSIKSLHLILHSWRNSSLLPPPTICTTAAPPERCAHSLISGHDLE
jgi:hypothetical protein